VTSSIVSSTPAVEAAPHTASIIPFPTRPKPEVPEPRQRLARALESLNVALADQKTAIAAWRDVLDELKASTASLDHSLRHYRANLRTLGNSVSSLRAKARSLEEWADGVLTPTD
jgi:hypothetical protein